MSQPIPISSIHAPLGRPIDRVTTESMTITPSIAVAMLEWNTKNRKINPVAVKHYSEILANGAWRLNGETIKFSRDRLLDGQHRLHACVATSLMFQSIVIFGLEDESFDTIDTGRKRLASDIFSVSGAPDARNAAAVTAMYMRYIRGNLKLSSRKAPYSSAALLEYYESDPRIDEALRFSRKMKPAVMNYTTAATAYRIFLDLDADLAARYMEAICHGDYDGLPIKAPAKSVHVKCLLNRTSHKKMPASIVLAMIIKGWNSTRKLHDSDRVMPSVTRDNYPVAI